MKKLLFLILLIIFPWLVSASDSVIVSSIEPIYQEDSGIVYDNVETQKIIFNDIGQEFKYKVVLENTTDKTLLVSDLKINEASAQFMKYSFSDIKINDEILAGDKKDIYITIETVNDKGYGYNLNDSLSFEVEFDEKFEILNPETFDTIKMMLSVLILSGLVFIYFVRKKQKVGMYFLLIPLFVVGLSFVSANGVIRIVVESSVAFESQNVLEPTGIYYVGGDMEITEEDGVTTYLDHSHDVKFDKIVDIWEYRKVIKNITVENEIRDIDDYAYKFDLSDKKNEKVIAYLVENEEDNSLYDCYIMANGLIYANKNSQGLFAEMYTLESINNLAGIDFSETTNMAMLFYDCWELNELDLSSFETSNVKDMSLMFQTDKQIEKIDLSNFDTSNVLDMYMMFCSMDKLKKLDISNFDTSSVKNMYMMFGFMTSLTELELGEFKTDDVVIMTAMFYNLPLLKSVDVSSFNTSNVTDMKFMFAGDPDGFSGFEEIKGLENFDTSNVTDMMSMFQNCFYVNNLSLNNFNTSKVEYFNSMFIDCRNLNFLDLSSFDFSSATTLNSFLAYTGQNVSDYYVDLSGFDFSNYNVSNSSSMFSHFASTHRIYVMNSGSRLWFTNKGFSNVNMNTVLIKEDANNGDSQGVVDNKYSSNDGAHYNAILYKRD